MATNHGSNRNDEGGANYQAGSGISRSSSARFPSRAAGQVRIKVQACGVCHSDVLTKEGLWPGIQYPRVPGHEVVGIIDEVGDRRFRVEEGPARRRRLARRP